MLVQAWLGVWALALRGGNGAWWVPLSYNSSVGPVCPRWAPVVHSVQLCYGGDAGVGAAWLPLELGIGLRLWQQASKLLWDEDDVDVVVDVR